MCSPVTFRMRLAQPYSVPASTHSGPGLRRSRARRSGSLALAGSLALLCGCEGLGVDGAVQAVDSLLQPELLDLSVEASGDRFVVKTGSERLVSGSVQKDVAGRPNRLTLSPNKSRVMTLPKLGVEVNGSVIVPAEQFAGQQRLEVEIPPALAYARAQSMQRSQRNQALFWELPLDLMVHAEGQPPAEGRLMLGSDRYFHDYVHELYRTEASNLPPLPTLEEPFRVPAVAPTADANWRLAPGAS